MEKKRIVIIGYFGSGKSTLKQALGEELDSLAALTEIGGSELEGTGRLAYIDNRKAIEDSDMVIHVIDSHHPYTLKDIEMLGMVPSDKPIIFVHTKVDQFRPSEILKLKEYIKNFHAKKIRPFHSQVLGTFYISLYAENTSSLDSDEQYDNIGKICDSIKEYYLDSAIHEAISVIPAIIDNHQNTEKFKSEFLKIEEHYKDPEFKLAIIGNFNSGKSTFLNALLGRELLSVSDLPTTAIPTYIRWNKKQFLNANKLKEPISDRENPVIVIHMTNNSKYILTGKNVDAFQKQTGIQLPHDVGEMLDYVTTTNSLIGKIEKIEISFPEREEFKNFSIIDTPGINPGDENSKQHILQTQLVLKDEADAAIILYTAKDAMSRDTKQFMEENAGHLMKDSIIVLTKMDLVPERQVDKLVRNTVKLIREQFHQKNPSIYTISAGEAFEYKVGRDESPKSAEWSRKFDQDISSIMLQLRMRRKILTSSKIAVLLTAMMDHIERLIKEESGSLDEEFKNLELASVQKLEESFKKMDQNYSLQIDSIITTGKSKVNGIVGQVVDSKCSLICSEIRNASNKSRLNWCLQTYYQDMMKGADSEVMSQINNSVTPNINRENQKYVKAAEDCLSTFNRYLGKINSKSANAKSVNITINSTSGASTSNSFLSDHAVLIAATGVALLLPGINILVLAGGWFLDRVRFDSKKGEAVANVKKSLADYKKTLTDLCKKCLSETGKQNKTWANNLLKDYKKKYQVSFDEAERTYNQHVSSIKAKLILNSSEVEALNSLKVYFRALVE